MSSTCPQTSVSLFSPPPGDTSLLPPQNCGSFPFYGRSLRTLTTIYEPCRVLNREDPHRMRQLGPDIAELTGSVHKRHRHRHNVPHRPLDHCDALTLADSTLLELHPDRTSTSPQSRSDLVLQCHDGPLAVRHVDELLETAEGDVSYRHRGRPIIGPFCAQRRDSSTHLGLWNSCTWIGKAHVILQSPTSSPMNAWSARRPLQTRDESVHQLRKTCTKLGTDSDPHRVWPLGHAISPSRSGTPAPSIEARDPIPDECGSCTSTSVSNFPPCRTKLITSPVLRWSAQFPSAVRCTSWPVANKAQTASSGSHGNHVSLQNLPHSADLEDIPPTSVVDECRTVLVSWAKSTSRLSDSPRIPLWAFQVQAPEANL